MNYWRLSSCRTSPDGWVLPGAESWAQSPGKREAHNVPTDFLPAAHVFPCQQAIDADAVGDNAQLMQAAEFIASTVLNTQLHQHATRCCGKLPLVDANCCYDMPYEPQQHPKVLPNGCILPQGEHGMLVPYCPALALGLPCNHMIVPCADATRWDCQRRVAADIGADAPTLRTLEEEAASTSEYACHYSTKGVYDDKVAQQRVAALRNSRPTCSLPASEGEQPTDEQRDMAIKGRRNITSLLHRMNGCTIIASVLASSYVLGYPDHRFSYATTPYNPYAYMTAFSQHIQRPHPLGTVR
jgi:hypothetical protein